MTLQQRFDHFNQVLLALMREGSKGGELGFHIFDYDPGDELQVRGFVKDLITLHTFPGSEIHPVECDLFLMMMDVLTREKVKESSILELVPQMEEKDGRERMEKALRGILAPKKIVDIIKEKSEGKNLILLTGVGKLYPLLRSHTILNNLQHVIDTTTLIMFYPGSYDEKELRLFHLFKDENYYRAFRMG
ncbi:MAG: DUF1788 domain-containing protein [Vulcanimicrobiota bacterium]